jgi:predicted RNA binding protein YcfA (HicA-like mRNA interferase family)
MPRLGPIKRRDLIKYLRVAGFTGPHSGTKHQFIIKGELRLHLPNPHQREIGKELLSKILQQAEINRETWEAL